MDIAIKGHTDIDVIKHRIYEALGRALKSQFAIPKPELPICKSNIRFAVKNFDRKTDLRSELNTIVL